MPYGNNLVVNGDAAASTNWTLSNAVIVTGPYFEISETGSMIQNITHADINTLPREYITSLSFMYYSDRPINALDIRAKMIIEVNYNDATTDFFEYPFDESFKSFTQEVSGKWYQLEGSWYTRENSIVSSLVVKILTNSAHAKVGVYNINLQRNITATEQHNDNINPHNLPLTITVDNNGIKATKAGDVKFWLQDDGDALYYGTVTAAQIDTTTAKIQSAQIETLTVGDNVVMGPSATISWLNVTEQPVIPPEYTDSDAVSAIQGTYIDGSNVWTINVYAENITGTYITGKNIRTGTSGARIEMSPTSGFGSTPGIVQYDPDGIKRLSVESSFTAGQIRFWNGATEIGRLSGSSNITLAANGSGYLILGNTNNNVLAYGHWDFSLASSVSGLNFAATSHTHSQYTIMNLAAGVSSAYLQAFTDHLEVVVNGTAHTIATY